MIFNELTPWERKNEYYKHIQLGKDVRSQTEAIKNQTKAMINAQLSSTQAILLQQESATNSLLKSQAAIVTSRESISERIEDVSYGLKEVSNGIDSLKSAFEWGISEVIWQIEQNRKILKSVLEVLQAPLETQGKELRKRAEEAYSNGWLDDALMDFLESEKKNRYDFSIHISLGLIYLFHKVNRQKAYEYFEKAVKYSRPKSNYHTSFSLLYCSLIKRDIGEINEAEKLSNEALNISPEFPEAIYQNALHNALLQNPTKAIQLINKLVIIDSDYYEKIVLDSGFDTIRKEISSLFESHRQHLEIDQIKVFDKIYDDFAKMLESDKEMDLRVIDNHKNINFERVKELHQRDTIQDYLICVKDLTLLKNDILRYSNDVKKTIKDKIYFYLTEMNSYNRKLDSSIYDKERKLKEIESSVISFNSEQDAKRKNWSQNFRIWLTLIGALFSFLFGCNRCMQKYPSFDNFHIFPIAVLSSIAVFILIYFILIFFLYLSTKKKKGYNKFEIEKIKKIEESTIRLQNEIKNKIENIEIERKKWRDVLAKVENKT